jgi:histone H3/H4
MVTFRRDRGEKPARAGARQTGQRSTGQKLPQAEISRIASEGGKARAKSLSAAERSRIAKLAVEVRERKRKERP